MTDNRMYGLDLLRAFLMFFGPIFHSGMLFEKNYRFIEHSNDLVYYFSAIMLPFRMEFYFAISGFFTFLLVSRKGMDYLRESKKKSLFIPTFWALIIFLPLTNFVKKTLSVSEGVNFGFHHVWFLISLSFITFFILHNPDFLMKFTSRLKKFSFFKVTFITLLLYCFTLMLRIFSTRWLTGYPIMEELVQNCFFLPFNYFIPFLYGAYLNSCEFNYRPTNRVVFISVLIYVMVYAVFVFFQLHSYGKIYRVVSRLFLMLASSYLMLNVFYFFKNLNLSPTKNLKFLSESALPFYLIHYPVVLFLASIFSIWIDNDFLHFVATFLGTFFISLIFCVAALKYDLTRNIFGLKSLKHKLMC